MAPRPFRISPSLWPLLTTLVAIAAFVGATFYSSSAASSIDEMAESIAGNADPSIRLLAAARSELHASASALTSSLLDGHHAAELRAELERHEGRMADDLDAYTRLPTFPTEHERWVAVDRELRDATAETNALLARLEAGDVSGATSLRAGPVALAIGRADEGIGDLIAFNADFSKRLGGEIVRARRRAEDRALALDALASVAAVLLMATAVWSTRRYVFALEESRTREERAKRRLHDVAEATVAIAASLGHARPLRDVLQSTVDTARSIASADYVALGMGNHASGRFDMFAFAGVEESLLARLGGPPRARGVLRAPMSERRTIRIDDVRADPRFGGLPEGHPPVGPFLGVPLRREGDEPVGHLYLARKPGGERFSDDETRAVEILGEFVAAAAHNATLYARLQEEIRSREDLMSMVSHDLRSPLSAMSLAAGVVKRDLEREPKLRKHVDLIARNVLRMDRLISDLLTAAKLHEGRLPVEPSAQDASQLVRDAVDLVATRAADKRIELRTDIDAETPPVFCDPGRIGQVLVNLLGNALKFTPAGGSVVVTVAPAESKREVSFSVRDTGIGISPDAIAHVFDRYWQESGQLQRRGTGLGLFISKGIVEAHGGCITVASRPGDGSEFRFTLPSTPPRGRRAQGTRQL